MLPSPTVAPSTATERLAHPTGQREPATPVWGRAPMPTRPAAMLRIPLALPSTPQGGGKPPRRSIPQSPSLRSVSIGIDRRPSRERGLAGQSSIAVTPFRLNRDRPQTRRHQSPSLRSVSIGIDRRPPRERGQAPSQVNPSIAVTPFRLNRDRPQTPKGEGASPLAGQSLNRRHSVPSQSGSTADPRSVRRAATRHDPLTTGGRQPGYARPSGR